jgi:hypothetical protein
MDDEDLAMLHPDFKFCLRRLEYRLAKEWSLAAAVGFEIAET